jgi:hypothetical protein
MALSGNTNFTFHTDHDNWADDDYYGVSITGFKLCAPAGGSATAAAAAAAGRAVNADSYTNIANNKQFCPAGWRLVTGSEANVIHNSYASDHDNSNTTGKVEHHCAKCPFGQISNGGSAPACFATSNTSCYQPCSHLTCKEVTVENKCFHDASVNPFSAILAPSANASGTSL